MVSDIFSIIAAKVFTNVISHGEPPNVYLTFDDGPDPQFTPMLLDILHRFDCKVTFFITAQKAERHPQIVRTVLDAGHAVGNHGYKHGSFYFRSRRQIIEDVDRSIGVISDITGCSPGLYRPPYGHFTSSLLSLAKNLGFKVVLWSLNAGDYLATPPTIIERRVGWRARPSDIVLMHDGVKYADNTLMALPNILEMFNQKNLSTGILDQNRICDARSESDSDD